MRVPLIEVLLAGRAISDVLLAGRAISVRLAGLAKLEMLARLLGLLLSLSRFSREGRGPKDNRLMPDVDNLLTCFADGVSSATDDAALVELPMVRFRLRIVTLGGI